MEGTASHRPIHPLLETPHPESSHIYIPCIVATFRPIRRVIVNLHRPRPRTIDQSETLTRIFPATLRPRAARSTTWQILPVGDLKKWYPV
jgi:hypothetical protein